MTGLNPERDRICEVAVVRGQRDAVEQEFVSLVKPDVRVSRGARKVHGLTDEDLSAAPSFSEVADGLQEALENSVVVGHNVRFDFRYLLPAFERAGRPFEPVAAVDTLLMARRLFAFRKNDLTSVCDTLGIPFSAEHRALGDARATRRVFARMLEILDPGEDVTLGELDELVEALAPGSPLRMKQQQGLREAYRRRRTGFVEYPSGHDEKYDFVRRELAIWKVALPRVQAWCYLREAERVFRVDRMRSVGLGDRDYEIPAFEERI